MPIKLDQPATYVAICDRCGVSTSTDNRTNPPKGWAVINTHVIGGGLPGLPRDRIACSDCVQAFSAVWTTKKTS